ncbi:MAG TPA: TetR/AcrR family transcriptional regulator [Streptosporangiaceae bacterium]|nr:TetR/AcrR family transcriptional regulator [Streptosporangiaceae bacterium]
MPAARRRRRPRGAVRDGLVAAGLELARTGGPEAVVLREATRMVGVVPNAAYRHFADRDELLAAVCSAAMRELAGRMAAGVARVPGGYGDPVAARLRLGAVGTAYLEFAREEPGLFATAFAVPQQHAYGAAAAAGSGAGSGAAAAAGSGARSDAGSGTRSGAGSGEAPAERMPLDYLRAALDELVDAGVLSPGRREGLEYPIWSTVHGLAVLAGPGPLRDVPGATRDHLELLTLGFINESLG